MNIDARFDDSLNFRDLGSLTCNDGRKVKEGYFYRGAGLAYFREDELKEFEKLDIRTIMDLRSNAETAMLPDPEIRGAELIEHSGLVVKGSEDIDWSPSGMRKIGGEAMEQLKKIESYYRNIAFGNEAFRIMMKEIAEDNVPIYFHCATGKDRTGVAAMILLSALNVREEEIRRDYLASNIFRKKILEESLQKVASLSADHPEIARLITLQDGVSEKTFDIVMSSIRERYGSVDAYLEEEFGLDAKALKDLRDRFTE